jgi:hypothetical protein
MRSIKSEIIRKLLYCNKEFTLLGNDGKIYKIDKYFSDIRYSKYYDTRKHCYVTWIIDGEKQGTIYTWDTILYYFSAGIWILK